jgi:hypothetical protein
MVAFGTRLELEQRFGAQRLVQLFDDDGDGVVAGTDLATLDTIMAEADDIVAGLLLNKGFTEEQLELLKTDKQIIRAWAGIAAQLAGERKPEWLSDEGLGPYDAFGQRGRAELKSLAAGTTRSIKESVAGINTAISGDVQRGVFVFAPDPNDPNDRYGPGGF